MHQLAEHRIRNNLRKDQSGLEVEQLLLVTGKHMVEIREYVIDIIGIRITNGYKIDIRDRQETP